MKLRLVHVVFLCTTAFVQGQTSPTPESAKVHDVPKDGLVIAGKLTKDDPPLAGAPVAELNGAPHQVFQVKLQKGQSYVIDLVSKDFDAYLILQNAIGKVLAHDDDSGDGLNSRIVAEAKTEGTHRLVVVALDRKPGSFQLRVRPSDFTAAEKLAEQAIALNALGLKLYAQGKPAEAVEKLEEALAIRIRLHPGGQHPELTKLYSNLIILCHQAGRQADAVKYGELALAARRREFPNEKFPDGHPHLAITIDNLVGMLLAQRQYERAEPLTLESVAIWQKQYPRDAYPNGHRDQAPALNNLGRLQLALGAYEEAFAAFENLARLLETAFPADRYPVGHPQLALTYSHLGVTANQLNQSDRSLVWYLKAVAMMERVYAKEQFPDGHPELALVLNNLGARFMQWRQYEKALERFEQALAMRRRLYPASSYPNGHPDIFASLSDLGQALLLLGQHEQAEKHLRTAFEQTKIYFPLEMDPHNALKWTTELNRLGGVYRMTNRPDEALHCLDEEIGILRRAKATTRSMAVDAGLINALTGISTIYAFKGEFSKAERSLQEALTLSNSAWKDQDRRMRDRSLTLTVGNLAALKLRFGKIAEARELFLRVLATRDEEIRESFAVGAEAEILAAMRLQPSHLYGLCSMPVDAIDAAIVAEQVWSWHTLLPRFVERRQAAALASRSPEVLGVWNRLAGLRRRLGTLMNQPSPANADGQTERDHLVRALTNEKEELERRLVRHLPTLETTSLGGPAELAKRLPAGAAYVELFHYDRFDMTKKPTGTDVYHREPEYLAVVIAPGQTAARVNLGPAEPIQQALSAWRDSIQTGGSNHGLALRRLVWEPIAQRLPAKTAQVYFVNDGQTSYLPWAALPGATPGTVLLEELAVAVVPDGAFLLSELRLQNAPIAGTVLAVGGVNFDSVGSGATRSDAVAQAAPVRSGAPRSWRALPGTLREVEKLRDFGRNAEIVSGMMADTQSLLAKLPTASIAHLATHGFCNVEEFTAEGKRRLQGLRESPASIAMLAGAGLRNPLAFSGLVLRRANRPDQAGPEAGILTGEAIATLDLSRMRLAVLSACQTGLGPSADGICVANLQQAFHSAGCSNVIGSLWNVSDTATAALMAKFYHEMWVNKKPPIEALREAQLTIYRHPELIPDLAGERGAPRLKEAVAVRTTAPATGTGKRADTKLWAAFVLSGMGK